jgi:hypothetical protein
MSQAGTKAADPGLRDCRVFRADWQSGGLARLLRCLCKGREEASMQKKLSKIYLSEAVREILLSVPDSSRAALTGAECERRVCEEYGDFDRDLFAVAWAETRRQLSLIDSIP